MLSTNGHIKTCLPEVCIHPLIFKPAQSDRDKHVLLQQTARGVRPSLGPVQLCPLKHWDLCKIDCGRAKISQETSPTLCRGSKPNSACQGVAQGPPLYTEAISSDKLPFLARLYTGVLPAVFGSEVSELQHCGKGVEVGQSVIRATSNDGLQSSVVKASNPLSAFKPNITESILYYVNIIMCLYFMRCYFLW